MNKLNKIININLIICAFLSFWIFFIDIYAAHQAALFYLMPPHGSFELAFKVIWLHEIPFLIFWLLAFIAGVKLFKPILWLYPIIALFILKSEITYFIYNHHFDVTFAIPFQLLAILASACLILGLITWLLWCIQLGVTKSFKNHFPWSG